MIVTPRRSIERNFTKFQGQEIWVGKRVIRIPAGGVRSIRGIHKRTTRALREYLARRNPGFAVVATHSAIAHLLRFLPADLSKCLLVVDEAHRVRGETNLLKRQGRRSELRSIVDEVRAKGGRVLYATATPDRLERQRHSAARHVG